MVQTNKFRQLYSEDKLVLFSTFYPTGENKIWKTNRINEFDFEFDHKEIKVKVKPPSRNDILLYNLPKYRQDIPSSEI